MSSLEYDSDDSGAMSEDEESPARVRLNQLLSGETKLQFKEDGERVFCPLCTDKDPKLNLQALLQHARDKSTGGHRELASYVLRQVLQLEGHPTNSQIAAAVKQRNAGLAPAGGAIKRPLEPVIKQEQVSSKIMRVFAPQVATGQADSSPEISWPPCVSVKEDRAPRTRTELRDGSQGCQQIKDWMESQGAFNINGITVHQQHDYHGRPTSNFLVTFPENLEGFLEAVQLWILLDGGAKKSDLCLKGYLVHSEIPRGSRKKHRLQPFSLKVLESYKSKATMLNDVQKEVVMKDAEHKRCFSEMTQLTDERKLLMDKFQDKVNEVEGERKKREEDRNEFLQQQKEKEKAQQLEIKKIQEEHLELLKSMQDKEQVMDDLAKQMQDVKLQHDVAKLDYEAKCAEDIRRLQSKHEEEINKLWENSEADRKRFKEEYEEKLKEATTREQMAEWHKSKEEERRRKKEQQQKVERMVNLVKNHMAEAYEKEKREIIEKEKKEKEMIEKEKKETIEKVEKEKSEEQEEMNEMINALVTKERHANDKIADLMDKVKKHWQNRSSEDHWIFGTSTHFEDSNLYMKPVGDLDSDLQFKEALWKVICKNLNLPADTPFDGPVKDSLADKRLDANASYAETVSFLQVSKVQSQDFMPFKTTDAGYQPTDKGMEDLLPKFGREVCDHLRRVTIEMYEANGSGRYVVFKPWLKDEDKEATPAEFVTAMNKRGSAMMELICRASHLNPSALEIAKKNPSLIKGVKTFQTRRSKRNQR